MNTILQTLVSKGVLEPTPRLRNQFKEFILLNSSSYFTTLIILIL